MPSPNHARFPQNPSLHQPTASQPTSRPCIVAEVDEPKAPLETTLHAATVQFESGFESVAEGGHDALLATLQQVSASGYALSAILDDPNVKMRGYSSTVASCVGTRSE